MNHKTLLDQISIRNTFQFGDMGQVIRMHSVLYAEEYQFGLQFERYVALGLCEFYEKYNPKRNRVWFCEDKQKVIGSLFLMDRGEVAQLRYFLIEPDYRGIGLGSKLMTSFMDFLHKCKYQGAFLWTTHELETAAFLYKRVGFKLTEKKESTTFGKPLWEHRYDLVLT